MPRVLLSRTDKLGDLLLTLSSVRDLKLALPDSQISLVCQPGLLPVVQGYLESIGVQGLSPGDDVFQTRWDAFGSFFSLPGPAFQALFKRIPIRVGQYSKGWSFLTYNSGLRQHRARAEKHESEYTLDLAALLFEKLTGKSLVPRKSSILLPVDEAAKLLAEKTLNELGIRGSKFGVLHPGMAGSALNLSESGYRQLWEGLHLRGLPFLLSEGPLEADRKLTQSLTKAFPDARVIRGQSLAVVKEIFRMADWVIAPSTGPLHLAHLVGTRTTGLFSPVQSQKPIRWAPRGGAGKVSIGVPELDCPATTECLGQRCHYYPCMEKHDWVGLILAASDG